MFMRQKCKHGNISDSDIATYEKAACFIENNDEIKEFEGLVKERTTVSVTDGDKSVISTFLVKSDKNRNHRQQLKRDTNSIRREIV